MPDRDHWPNTGREPKPWNVRVVEAIAQEVFYEVAYAAGTFEILLRPTTSQ
jgi:hypothetical protein